jgi:ATP-dependent Lhr-like helicase
VRAEIAELLEQAGGEHGPAIRRLQAECKLDRRGAEQAVAYVAAGKAVLGAVPIQETVVAERFFDEGGGMQLVIHAPFGGRVNRAWGLALRKRFCTAFDFELQAAATDEGIVVSLGERHSFPLEAVFAFLRSETVTEVLKQAVLAAPMFMSRWRWNATRALALLRFANGRRVPPQIQRMRAEDLLGAVFPAATACQDNHRDDAVPCEVPDHPLVQETMRDCLTDAMDLDGLRRLLERIEQGSVRCIAVDTPLPSPFCHEILNANPYAYLDDAPLEERRARAVEMRRSLPPDLADRLGALDPNAVAEVAKEAWPAVRDADELHDALLTLVWLPQRQASGWEPYLPTLLVEKRAGVVNVRMNGGIVQGWTAAESAAQINVLFPDAEWQPPFNGGEQDAGVSREDALLKVVQGWMESTGPTRADELADILCLPVNDVMNALLALEAGGQVLRGRLTRTPEKSDADEAPEWCDRRLLARIHRLTIGRLRKEVQPVTAAAFMRFLFQWHHLTPGARLHGESGLLEIVRRLAGFEAQASAWERYLLPSRLAKYDPELLDRLCLSGSIMWGRLNPHPRLNPEPDDRDRDAVRRIVPTSLAPISFFPREDAEWLMALTGRADGAEGHLSVLSPIGRDLWRYLRDRGASFFADLVRGTGHLQSEVEDGLWELTAAGLVTADGFDNLRALLDPRRRRAQGRDRHRRPRHGAGRWSLLRPVALPETDGSLNPVECAARLLLRRYGVVFRDLLGRESLSVAWRDLLVQYRRMELRGEIRGGRFVDGFTGEQFALPEAVEALRAVRRSEAASQDIKVSGADPLNLVGIILPGARVPAVHTNYIVFRDGVPVRTGVVRDIKPGARVESGRARDHA